MSASLDAFRQAAAGSATRLKIDAAGTGVVATGKTAGGRAVEWFSEAVGQGKLENRKAITDLVSAIRREMGDAAGDAADLMLGSRLRHGKPLSARTTAVVIRNAENLVREIKEERGRILADLAPNPASVNAGKLPGTAFDILRTRVADGHIAPGVQNRMLNDPANRTALEGAIRRAVTAAEAQAGTQPAGNLADLTAVERAIDAEAVRVGAQVKAAALFAPGPGGTPPQVLMTVAPMLEAMGLPAGRVLDALTPAQMRTAEDVLAGAIAKFPGFDTDPTVQDEVVSKAMARQLGGAILHLLSATDGSAEALVRDLHFEAALDPDSFGHAVLSRAMAAAVNSPNEHSNAVSVLGQALMRGAADFAERAGADGSDRLTRAVSQLGLGEPSHYRASSPADRPGVLAFAADMAEAHFDAIKDRADIPVANRSHARSEAVYKLTEVANVKLEAIKDTIRARQVPPNADAFGSTFAGQRHELRIEVNALSQLRRDEPELVARLNRLLPRDSGVAAQQGGLGLLQHPKDWISDRQDLAILRAKLSAAAELSVPDQAGNLPEGIGNDMQRMMSGGMRDIVGRMFERATLELGEPAPPFTAVMLGSAARGEASPFSDLEFGILLDEGADQEAHDYAARLTEHMRDQVFALGETASEVRGVGFHWDPIMNPLSRPHFIGSASDMVQRTVGTTDLMQQTMFINTEWYFGSDAMPGADGTRVAPDESLQRLQTLHRGVETFVRGQDAAAGPTRGAEMGAQMIEMAAEMAGDGLRGVDQGQVDVKSLARLPMLLAQGLAMQHGIVLDDRGDAANSTYMRMEELVKAGVLSRDDADAVVGLQDKLSSVRVRSHLAAGAAEDKVFIGPPDADPGGLLHVPELGPVVDQMKALVARTNAYLANPGQPF